MQNYFFFILKSWILVDINLNYQESYAIILIYNNFPPLQTGSFKFIFKKVLFIL